MKFTTMVIIIAGLLPFTRSAGSGADVMKRIAAPMVGGLLTALLPELTAYNDSHPDQQTIQAHRGWILRLFWTDGHTKAS